MYDPNDISTWREIDQNTTDPDLFSRLYVYDTVMKTIDMADDNGEPLPSRKSEWNDILGEEIAWSNKQGDFPTEAFFNSVCGYTMAYLAFFLCNHPRTQNIDWDN